MSKPWDFDGNTPSETLALNDRDADNPNNQLYSGQYNLDLING